MSFAVSWSCGEQCASRPPSMDNVRIFGRWRDPSRSLCPQRTTARHTWFRERSAKSSCRVSALRAWEAVRNRGSSSSASAAPVFPGPPRRGDSDVAELAGGGEGGAASSGQAELATGSAQRPAKAPAAAQRRGARLRQAGRGTEKVSQGISSGGGEASSEASSSALANDGVRSLYERWWQKFKKPQSPASLDASTLHPESAKKVRRVLSEPQSQAPASG